MTLRTYMPEVAVKEDLRALKRARWLLLLTCLIVLGAVSVYVFVAYPPSYRKEIRFNLAPPFHPGRGHEFLADLPTEIVGSRVCSDQAGRGMSPLVLLENGRKLGPAHAFRAELQRSGKGAFLHWGGMIYFSSSDNSDPGTNGRTYQVAGRVGRPLILYFGLLFIGFTAILVLLMALQGLAPDSRRSSILVYAAIVMVSLIVLELACWVLVENQLANYGPLVRKVFTQAIDGGPNLDAPNGPGLTANYVPHHYLNYVLNPEKPYCGTKQFNSLYKIRRTEAISSEKGVRWRALILGGSTTFCEGIPREEDTWPYLLESIIRKHCGPDCDVINGGVGGYTLLENFIHYIVLLNRLSPDLVMFYTGINDVHPRLFGKIVPDYSNYRVPWRASATEIWRPNPWLRSFYWYRYYFLNKVVLDAMYQGIGGQVSRKGPPPAQWEEALKRNSGAIYRDQLDSFIRLLRRRGIKVAILPQYFSPITERDRIFAKGVRDHNRINEELAREHGLPFGSRLLAPDLFQASDIFDACHFNEDGSRKMADAVFEFMKHNKLAPDDCGR